MHLLLRTGGGVRAVSLARTRCASAGTRRLPAPPSKSPLSSSASSPLVPRPSSSSTRLLLLSRNRSSSSKSGGPLSTAQQPPAPPTPAPPLQFCRRCGASPMAWRVPEGDTHARHLCPSCGHVEYRNPRLVVGCLVLRGSGPAPREVLLCRRAIEPARGRWTLPAGYLEVGESTAQGAAREALEETGADVEVLRPYAHFDVPAIGQAYLLFLARVREGGRLPANSTTESLETRWFRVVAEGGEREGEGGGGGGGGEADPVPWSEGGGEGGGSGGGEADPVPWSELAFSSVETALRLYAEDAAGAAGASPSACSFPSPLHFRQHHGVIERQPGAGPNEAGTYLLRDHTWSGGSGGGGGGGSAAAS